VPAPKYLRRSERRLKIRQRRLARCAKGSRNRQKAAQRVAVQHEKIANQRKDFHHKLSRSLVDRYGCMTFEDLNVNGMLKNHRLARSIQDAGWSQFVRFCEYKAAWTGGTVLKSDRFFPSSKMCSVCGEINPHLKLSDRSWCCTGCGTIHDRDINAATNNLNATIVGATKSHASGDTIPVGESAQEKFCVGEQLSLPFAEAQAFRLG
jgi:putative transposase